MKMKVLPALQDLQLASGTCCFGSMTSLIFSGLNKSTLGWLRELFPKADIKQEKKGFYVCAARDGSTPAANPVPLEADAYVIQSTENGLRLDANTAAGLFYGVQTLRHFPGGMQSALISDFAAIPMRVLHWDLKGYQPSVETFKQELEILASFKINGLLLEIEDKYAYRCAPGFCVPDAYSFEDLREISRRAAELNISIIPKLQCLAHVDYLLVHEGYRELRENGHSFQYCATNPSAQQLWCEMADELMQGFAEHPKYFHVGADETDYLGDCPECRKLGKGGSYIHKVEQCLDFVLSRGRTPIMWEDILRNLHHSLCPAEAKECWRLGRKAILMYWAYGYGGKKNTFPYLHNYLEAGIPVWGASGFSGCDNFAGSLPPLEIRVQNLDAWSKSAIENKLPGLASTGWSKIASADCPAEPAECAWFSSLYAADSMWNGKPRPLDDFIVELAQYLYGCSLEEPLTLAVKNIARHPYPFEQIADQDNSNHRLALLRYAAAAESLVTDRTRIINYFQYYHGRLGHKLPDYRLNMMRKYAAALQGKISHMKAEIRPLLREFYQESSVEAFMVSRFGYLEKLLGEFVVLLAATQES